jgi:shikimate dehydrogenase
VSDVVHRDALWLLGDDIARSLSPAMHNAALAVLGSSLRYTLHPTTRDGLAETLRDAERLCRGVNVTIPLKVNAFEHYRAVADDDARSVGAVNTIVFADDGAVSAHNTDVEGLLYAWRRGSVTVTDRAIVVFGAGGAARAVVVAAARAGAKQVGVIARRPDEAKKIEALAQSLGLSTWTRAHEAPALVVMATPTVDAPESVLRGVLVHPATVHDLRVRPETSVRNAALTLGHLYLEGTTMLLGQGIRALELFVGEKIAPDARRAMSDAVAMSGR